MKTLLITGRFPYYSDSIDKLKDLGFNILRSVDEISLSHQMFLSEYIICNTLFEHHDIAKFPNLKFIQLTSSGTEKINLSKISNNIKFYSAKGVYSIPIAEFVISRLLDVIKLSRFFYDNQKKKLWKKNFEIDELYGLNVLIFGYGSIGKEVAKRLYSFGVNITGVSRTPINSEFLNESISILDSDSHLAKADIVIITLPLSDSTFHYFNYNRLNMMKQKSIIINVSRGKVINEKDLIYFLNQGKFMGVILDVFEEEPLVPDSELWKFENVIITPHNSYFSKSNESRLLDLIISNIGKN